MKVGAAERRQRLQVALDANLGQGVGAAPVITLPVAGLDVKVATFGQPRPFWLLRTHGLAFKAGVEVALRVPRGKDETQLPPWVAPVLERLIAHAHEKRLSAGQIVRWHRPFGEGAETELEAFAIGVDPLFGTVQTPHDAVPVLLAVGITGDEERLVREWSPHALLDVLSRLDPTVATTLDRPSLLASPRARLAIEHRVEKEGSSMGVLQARVSAASVAKNTVSWKLDAESAGIVVSLLKGRIGHQRPFLVKSDDFEVELAPGDQPAISVDGHKASLKLNQVTARNMRATLKARPGTYSWETFPNFTLEVVQ
ncbi:MAG: suppressor of fused domain protein [Myxococcaceae bacterium]|nr:suppressor of fused domain protein [Myxococcaceae bacterium]